MSAHNVEVNNKGAKDILNVFIFCIMVKIMFQTIPKGGIACKINLCL